VEGWFAALTAKQIKRDTHRSTVALEQASKDYLNTYNEKSKPSSGPRAPTRFSKACLDLVSALRTQDTATRSGEAGSVPAFPNRNTDTNRGSRSVLDRDQTLDETEADALRGLVDILRTHFGPADEQPLLMKPRREDVVRLAQELPEDRIEAAWRALIALL
jgi:hypothetical protein